VTALQPPHSEWASHKFDINLNRVSPTLGWVIYITVMEGAGDIVRIKWKGTVYFVGTSVLRLSFRVWLEASCQFCEFISEIR